MAARPKGVAGLVALFYSLPLDGLDFQNLAASGCDLVQLDFYVSATDEVLKELQRRGHGVILRLNDHDSMHVAPQKIAADLKQKRWVCPNIEAVILGCEFDVGLDLRFGSPTWGTDRAWKHQARITVLAETLEGSGVKLITPGWECRTKSEDDPPQPGLYTLRDICADAYHNRNISGHAGHMYCYGFKSAVDEWRVKWQLRELKERFHKGPLYLDEVGFASGPPVARMQQFVTFLGFLERNPKVLERIALLSPFTSNGTPNGQWDENWLFRSPECYTALGAFLKGARVPVAA